MRRISLMISALLFCLLLSSCTDVFEVPVLDGDSAETKELRSGDLLEGPVAVYTAQGDIIYAQQSYEISEDLYGVVYNPPEGSVMDVYGLAQDALLAGEPVLILFLDGFGYSSYQRALEAGEIPNLARLDGKKALSVFPTITPVNYAAMVTGQPPILNGVKQRGDHDLACQSIFDQAVSMEKTVQIIEGDTQILNFSVPQELNPDLDGDGGTDGEVFENALAVMEAGGCDLLFVHFHGIDDVSHGNGPHAEATLEKIRQVDMWAGALMDKWEGKIIVIADHGQHENDGIGDEEYADKEGIHGAFVPSDIYVPLLTN